MGSMYQNGSAVNQSGIQTRTKEAVPIWVVLWDTRSMVKSYPTVSEVRRANLSAVIRNCWGGMSAPLARAIGIPQTQITRCLSDTTTARNVGDKLARDIEAASGLPNGWMDHQHAEFDAIYEAVAELPADQRETAAELLRALARSRKKP